MNQSPNLSAIEDGQTPLTPEELADIKPKHIKTISDLNQFENANIDQAFQKYLVKKKKLNLFDMEIAVRFHYKLVWIHPFSNGNGRHARFVADIFLFQKDLPLLPWGSSSETTIHIQRKNYIAALRKADEGDFSSLLKFAIYS